MKKPQKESCQMSYSDEERRFLYNINQGHLKTFCIVFVGLRGSALTSQDYNPSSVVYVSKPVRAIWQYLLSEFCALLCCSLSQCETLYCQGAVDVKRPEKVTRLKIPHSNTSWCLIQGDRTGGDLILVRISSCARSEIFRLKDFINHTCHN